MIKASITLLYFIFHSPPTILLFFQVILRQSLYLGGVPTFEMVSPFITVRESFSGCIQKVSFCILTTYCNIVLIKVSMKSRVTHIVTTVSVCISKSFSKDDLIFERTRTLHCAFMGLDRWCTSIQGRFCIQVKPNHIHKVENDVKKYFDEHFLSYGAFFFRAK